MAKLTAADRLARLLAIIPWVTSQDGPTIGEISQRFEYPPEELLADLSDVVFFVGVYPFTPDTLIEVELVEDRVWIRYADWFSRPLRLTSEQALALITAGRTVLAASGDDQSEPLLRGLAKLQAAVGAGGGAPIDVRLGDASEQVLASLRAASADARQIEIDYYSYGRDERSIRVINPRRVFADEGNWYVEAYCNRAEADRLFRVDRIVSASVQATTFATEPSTEPAMFANRDNLDTVTIDIAPTASWVATQYPNQGCEDLADGWTRVQLPVSAGPWLERLLLRLGPEARFDDDEVRAARSARAQATLRRYVTGEPQNRAPGRVGSSS